MKKIFLISLLALVASCSSYSTHGKFLTEHQDAWIDGYVPGGHPTYPAIDRAEDGDSGLVFCRANVNKDNGKAAPVCYKPKFEQQK